jgi:uncharacterized protein (UPF0335 family)|tara:strand:- start:691 stop:930 length:240 start_codon:yes stop_codon:yes gene_type:complete
MSVDHDAIVKFLENYLRVENEIKLLQEEKKLLFEDVKDRISPKALKAAIQIAKIRAKLGDSEIELDDIFDTVSRKISII